MPVAGEWGTRSFVRPLLPVFVLAFACANPFGAPVEESPAPPAEEAPPPPPPAPVDPDIPVKDRVERVTTPVGDGVRVSYVHLPGRRVRGKMPLVVVLHGGREADPRQFGRQVDHWFDRGVVVALAGSRDRTDGAKAKGKGKGKGSPPSEGKVGKGRDADDEDLAWQEVEDPEFVEALVSDIVATKDVDPRQVYVVGLGSGAELVWTLACTSRRFAGYAVVSGGLSRDQAAVCPMPGLPAKLVVLQANEDPWLLWTGDEHYVGVTDAMELFGKRLGCDLAAPVDLARDDLDPDDGMTVTQRDWTCPDGGLRLFEISGQTHGWPTRTPPPGHGPKESTHDIDTMDELASFWGFRGAR